MNLFRDVMDKQIVDKEGHKTGKVDDLCLDIPPGERPIVQGIVTQEGAVADILGGPFPALAGWLRHHLLGITGQTGPISIGWEHVTTIDVVIHIDLDRYEAGLMDAENAIWNRWIKHIPFAER